MVAVGNNGFGLVALLLMAREQEIIAASIPDNLVLGTSSLVEKIISAPDLSIAEGAALVTDDIIRVRFSFLEWLAESENPELYWKLMRIVNRELSLAIDDYKHGELGDAVKRSLELITKVSQGDGVQKIVEGIANNRFSIGTFNLDQLRVLLPAIGVNAPPVVNTFQKLAISSVQLEYGLILFALVVEGRLQYNGRLEKLGQFIYDSTQIYAACSIVLGFWTPEKDDLSNEVVGARLLAGSYQIENGNQVTKSIDELLKL